MRCGATPDVHRRFRHRCDPRTRGGAEALEKRLADSEGPFLVSPLVIFESAVALARQKSANRKPSASLLRQAFDAVAAFAEDIEVDEIAILARNRSIGSRCVRGVRQSRWACRRSQFRRLLRLCLRQDLAGSAHLQGQGLRPYRSGVRQESRRQSRASPDVVRLRVWALRSSDLHWMPVTMPVRCCRQ